MTFRVTTLYEQNPHFRSSCTISDPAFVSPQPLHFMTDLTSFQTFKTAKARVQLRFISRPDYMASNLRTSDFIPRKKAMSPKRTPLKAESQYVSATFPTMSATENGSSTSSSTESTWENSLDEKRRDIGRIFKLFTQLALPYWQQEKQARWDLATVIAFSFMQSGISVVFSYIGRDFWNALSAKDYDLFIEKSTIFFLALVVGTPIIVMYGYLRDRLALRWRQWLTNQTLIEYFQSQKYYQIDANNLVDNPDQRIEEDLRSFTKNSLFFILSILTSTIDLVAFSFILYSIYPQLFIVLIAYSAFGTVTTGYLGRKLVGVNFKQFQTEADFRYSMVRLRENSESVAFYQGEKKERSIIKGRLEKVVENYYALLGMERNLDFFTTGYRYLIQILPALAVAPLYFTGKIQLGVVSQSFSAFNHILNDLSLIVNQFEKLSRFSAGIDRFGEFIEVLEKDTEPEKRTFFKKEDFSNKTLVSEEVVQHSNGLHLGKISKNDYPGIQMMESQSATIRVRNLSLVTPDFNRKLVENVNFEIKSKSLLVVGPSGTGKSSLLRAIAGLWTTGSGVVERAPLAKTFFIPQRPYCSLGSLREQLLYPMSVDEISVPDSTLMEALEAVDLGSLPSRIGGLDAVRDFSGILSLGEQQRLAFGRLMLGSPLVAILDESSSALDLASEAKLYNYLKNCGMKYISVGHRPSLYEYHDCVLRLNPDSSWELEEIDKSVLVQR